MNMSVVVKPRYITDENGKCTDVLLTADEYEALIEELEELSAEHAYDKAMQNPEFISWEEVRKSLDV